MEDSKSYTALRTSRKSHFKSFNYSSHYYIWKKVSQPMSVDANISEIQGNSEATAGTEELKLLSTLKLKRTLCERGKEKKTTPFPYQVYNSHLPEGASQEKRTLWLRFGNCYSNRNMSIHELAKAYGTLIKIWPCYQKVGVKQFII